MIPQLQATLNFKSNDLFGFLQSPDLECLGTLAGAWQVADGLPGRRFRGKDVSCGGAQLPRRRLKVPSTEPAGSQRGENQGDCIDCLNQPLKYKSGVSF